MRRLIGRGSAGDPTAPRPKRNTQSCNGGGTSMSVDFSKSHAAMDREEHVNTYGLFMKLVKWGTASVGLILILMAYFLT